VITPDPTPWEVEMLELQEKIGLAQREVKKNFTVPFFHSSATVIGDSLPLNNHRLFLFTNFSVFYGQSWRNTLANDMRHESSKLALFVSYEFDFLSFPTNRNCLMSIFRLQLQFYFLTFDCSATFTYVRSLHAAMCNNLNVSSTSSQF
jgi:hypothetical protein